MLQALNERRSDLDCQIKIASIAVLSCWSSHNIWSSKSIAFLSWYNGVIQGSYLNERRVILRRAIVQKIPEFYEIIPQTKGGEGEGVNRISYLRSSSGFWAGLDGIFEQWLPYWLLCRFWRLSVVSHSKEFFPKLHDNTPLSDTWIRVSNRTSVMW